VSQEPRVWRGRQPVGQLDTLLLLVFFGARPRMVDHHQQRVASGLFNCPPVGGEPKTLDDDPEPHLEKVPTIAALRLDQLLREFCHNIGD